MLAVVVPVLALVEAVFSTAGENRIRARWALLVFGIYASLFPVRAFVEPLLDVWWPLRIVSTLVDFGLQLVLPLGLLYATLRYRLLDLSFAINRGLVYGIISALVLMTFFGLEKASEGLLRFEGREQNALVAIGTGFAIFLFFHRMRHWVEHNVERLFFSAWHHKEQALREFVRSAAHITRIEALVHGCVTAVGRFTDGASCALYRREATGDFTRVTGTAADAPDHLDANDPVALAMRLTRATVSCEDAGSSLPAELALPILYRGDVDGFMLLGRKPTQENYRPDEIEVLGFAVQQVGLDLTALEREQFRERVRQLEGQADSARSHAEELRALLRLALGGPGSTGTDS